MHTNPAIPEGASTEGGASKKPLPARERILDAAAALFYREGIHAVGVDAIVAESGVAKMSFYRHFPSKDDLIRAVLELHDRRYWTWWDRAMALHPDDPRQQVRDLFAAVAERLHQPAYRGCAFINFTAEFAQLGHPGYDVVTSNKRQQRERLRALAGRLNVADPDLLADQLLFLMEGARVSALTLGETGPALQLPRAAEAVVAGHAPQRS
jgi:AcrR family transcriptional regulator